MNPETPQPADPSNTDPQPAAEDHIAQAQQDTEAANSTQTAQDKVPLHRVIDVPLAVTIRFGQRRLTLRELLELNTGSLVELDRQVEEPVDLMLGDRIVARGEVVIVDGNYGMRVTEVIENVTTALPAPR